MKRVLLVINSIGYGGAERALVNLLSKPSFYSEFDVHVALLDDEPIVRTLPVSRSQFKCSVHDISPNQKTNA